MKELSRIYFPSSRFLTHFKCHHFLSPLSLCLLVFSLSISLSLSLSRSLSRFFVFAAHVSGTRLFCIGYDVIITKPFFRNHLILMFFSINGYTQSVYFPLMLMDIMNNSKDLANIARSVTDNMGALGWVFYLFICTVVIYAQVKKYRRKIKKGKASAFLNGALLLSSLTHAMHDCFYLYFVVCIIPLPGPSFLPVCSNPHPTIVWFEILRGLLYVRRHG